MQEAEDRGVVYYDLKQMAAVVIRYGSDGNIEIVSTDIVFFIILFAM